MSLAAWLDVHFERRFCMGTPVRVQGVNWVILDL
jgi:hypothetical protein